MKAKLSIFAWGLIFVNCISIETEKKTKNFFLSKYVHFCKVAHVPKYTQKAVSLNHRNISLIYGQWKNFFEIKKVSLIQKKFLWSKEIDLFTLKKIFWINKTFFNSKKFFLWPHIKEMFFWFKETVSSVYSPRINVFFSNTIFNSVGPFVLWIAVIKKRMRFFLNFKPS